MSYKDLSGLLPNVVPLHSISKNIVPLCPAVQSLIAPRTSRITRTTRNLVNYYINLNLNYFYYV